MKSGLTKFDGKRLNVFKIVNMVAYVLVASPFNFFLNRGKISSVGRAGGRAFDSRGRTNTQDGLKITEK